jgi:hypothetical protein
LLTHAATPAQLPDCAVVVGTAVVLCEVGLVGGAVVGADDCELVETVTGAEDELPPLPCLIAFLIAASYRLLAACMLSYMVHRAL